MPGEGLRKVCRVVGAPALTAAALVALAAGGHALVHACDGDGSLRCVLFSSVAGGERGAEPRYAGSSTVAGLRSMVGTPGMASHSDGHERRPPPAPQPQPQARPFDHGQHERLSCGECHGSGERHRTITVRTSYDCATCHHDPRRGLDCSDCHRGAELAAPKAVVRTLELTVWEQGRTRSLSFAHEEHRAIACRECHATPVTLAMNRACGACHADHHRPEANCAACHAADGRAVHDDAAHLTCAGSACHAPAVAPDPVLSRSLCLMCHREQQDHEAGGECAACHGIPGVLPGPATRAVPAASGGGRRP